MVIATTNEIMAIKMMNPIDVVSEIFVKLLWFHHLMIKGLPLRLHQLDTFWDINLLYVTLKNCEFLPQISKKLIAEKQFVISSN